MKKILALLVVIGFTFGVAGTFSADAAVKKAPAKKVVKKAVKKAVKKMAPKAAPAPAPAPVAPVAPPPVAPVPPPPAPVVSTPGAGIFGLGWDTDVKLGYVAGKSLIGGGVDLFLGDPLMLASWVGLKADSLKWRVGLAGYTGKDVNNINLSALPLSYGGILYLPTDWMGGMETYISGGLNYVLYGTGKTGSLGGEVYVGTQGDLGLGLGGKSFLELGYSVVRGKRNTAKGLAISVGQMIKL